MISFERKKVIEITTISWIKLKDIKSRTMKGRWHVSDIQKLRHPMPKEAAKFKWALKHIIDFWKIAQQVSLQHGTWYNVNAIYTSNNLGEKINHMPSGNF